MDAHLPLELTYDYVNHTAEAVFVAISLRERLDHVRKVSVPVEAVTMDELLALGEVEFAERRLASKAVVLRVAPRTVLHVDVARGYAGIMVAGETREDADRVAEAMAASLHDPEDHDDAIHVTFWSASSGGVQGTRRELSAPAWQDVRPNYPTEVRRALDALMAASRPGPGRLLLFHGDPGTGKSFVLRALAREWAAWCDSHFLVDPEALLGPQSGSLVSSLLRQQRRADGSLPWRLLIIEDAGELLAADARARSGQGLSRLLNLTDGLLGEGLNAMVVVTTNEPLRRLHEAVSRPGRCWAQVQFGPLAAEEADAWLRRRGAGAIGRAASLAELFATADGREVAARVPVGFSRAR